MNTKAIPVAIQAVIRDRYPGKEGRIDRRILKAAAMTPLFFGLRRFPEHGQSFRVSVEASYMKGHCAMLCTERRHNDGDVDSLRDEHAR